jgi:DNA-binding transcriptional MerR regulator
MTPIALRRAAKSATAFRTISEVAEELDLPQHVLRFWESKFPQIKPLKRGGGRRYYRPEDVLLLGRIRQCLYDQGYTIRGVQRLLRDGTLRLATSAEGSATMTASAADAEVEDTTATLMELRDELLELRDLLRHAMKPRR